MTANDSLKSLSAAEYSEFCERLESTSGIQLNAGKEYLVLSRLRKLLAQRNLPTVAELIYSMDRDSQLERQVIDAMTTNETLWFRDTHPFQILRDRIFPELAQQNTPIRIWSAACSTGQEPYSIKMEELEYRRRAARLPDLSVLATDLSPTALSEAKSGAYPWIAIRRGLSGPYQEQYFTKTSEDVWTVKPEVRKGIEFREFNLNDSYTRLGQFDVVFCRNVLIYFSSERKRDILIRIHGALKEGGYLFLGASEALTNLSDYYDMISCRPGIIYRKKAFAAGR